LESFEKREDTLYDLFSWISSGFSSILYSLQKSRATPFSFGLFQFTVGAQPKAMASQKL
jgi:hypothetical protein